MVLGNCERERTTFESQLYNTGDCNYFTVPLAAGKTNPEAAS